MRFHAYSKTPTGRLVLLASLALLAGAGLAVRAASLATGEQAAARRRRAESLLVKRVELPALRGRLLDRRGEVLAADAPGWDLSVHYRVLSGAWASDQATRAARRDPRCIDGTDAVRQAVREEMRAEYSARLTRFWSELARVLGRPEAELRARANAVVARIDQQRTSVVRGRFGRLAKARAAGNEAAPGDAEWKRLASEFVLPEEGAQHVVASDLSEDERTQVQELLDRALLDPEPTPGDQARLELRRIRRYPFEEVDIALDPRSFPPPLTREDPITLRVEGVGTQVLGWMRGARAADVEADPVHSSDPLGGPIYNPHGLRPGDPVGASGAERAFDLQLRGSPGRLVRRTDPAGGPDQIERVAPQPGKDVVLSLDIRLQARLDAVLTPEAGLTRVQDYMRRESDKVNQSPLTDHLNGSLLVLDARTAEIMAACSFPGASRRRLAEEFDVLLGDELNRPLDNRFAGKAYAPGSVMKPLVLAAAIAEGAYQPGEIIDFPGHLWVKHPTMFQDYIWNHSKATYGKHDLAYGLAVSSTPVFGLLAQTKEDRTGIPRLGPQRTLDWLRHYGFGQAPRMELAGAVRGDLGKRGAVGVGEPDACWMVVGQGPIKASPLQLGTAYARMLTGDLALQATLLPRPPGWAPAPAPDQPRIPAAAVDFVLKGMGQAVTERLGTLHQVGPAHAEAPLFNVPGAKVWGKSGTAQTGERLMVDLDGDKKRETMARSGDMAWTVALCAAQGEARPRYIIVAQVEWGGSGGRVAGPLANQAVHALKAEGYLEKAPKE